MHSDLQPVGSGRIRTVRARATRRAFGFVASVALIAAAVVTVPAPSASASGSYDGITGCTIEGERNQEFFLKFGESKRVDWNLQGTLLGTGASNDSYYWWEVQTRSFFSGQADIVLLDEGKTRGAQASPLAVTYQYNSTTAASVAASVWVIEFFRIAGFNTTAAPYGTGPLGDPLCSVTLVFADADGNDPRPAPQVPPVETPISAPTTSVSCSPMPAAAGATVTCTITGGDPGIDILWRASYNPVFAEAGVTLGADGTGTFSFVVPAAARGEEVMVELVDWAAPMSLGVSGSAGVVPTRIPAGEGPGAPTDPLAVTVALALVAGMVVRRRASGHAG